MDRFDGDGDVGPFSSVAVYQRASFVFGAAMSDGDPSPSLNIKTGVGLSLRRVGRP